MRCVALRAAPEQAVRARVLAAAAAQLSGAQLDAALREAQLIKSENHRAEVLVALAPRLSGAQLDAALAAARVALTAKHACELLSSLMESDPKTHLPAIRLCLLYMLESKLTQGTSAGVLVLIGLEFPCWTIVGPNTVTALARHIVEIGHQWRWL